MGSGENTCSVSDCLVEYYIFIAIEVFLDIKLNLVLQFGFIGAFALKSSYMYADHGSNMYKLCPVAVKRTLSGGRKWAQLVQL